MLCSRCTLFGEPEFIKSHGKFPDTLFSAPFAPTDPPGRVCCLERTKFLFCLCQCFRGSRRSNLPFGHRNRPSLWYGHLCSGWLRGEATFEFLRGHHLGQSMA